MTANGNIINSTAATPVTLMSKGIWLFLAISRAARNGSVNVSAKDVSETSAVTMEAVNTIRNFPTTSSSRRTGLARIVSIVPRSFSPAVKSMAGASAPMKQRKMIR